MSRGRPRPLALVRIDPENPYARIGVSPTASTAEIKKLLDERTVDAKARARASNDKIGTEVMQIQKIYEVLAKPERRAAYDRMNPWNELLTVQLPASARALESPHRASLVTAALIEELGPEPLLPSAQSLALWAPAGWPEELNDLLGLHPAQDVTSADDSVTAATMLSPEELDQR